ncbi:hypothetical protein BDZ89DRAFT_942499 [Hymenopellis radicata]|nr:hypothetical protein BDZ89DRAFT_942499 [Hymenopellis radicata]
MHTSRPLHFHLICTPENIEYMEGKFALFDRPAYPVEVTYYPITPEQVQDRVHRAGIGGNWNLLSKVFIHELLVDIDRAIFIDTDMIFVVDPLQLWKNFADFGEDQLMSFPTMGPQSHAGKICSCVMLMDLARMRDVQFMPSTLLPAREALASIAFARGQSEGLQSPVHKGEIEPFDPMNPWFGDQGIYHVVWHFLPEHFRDLSQRWDVNFCRQQWGLKLGHWGDDLEEDMTEAELIRSQIRLDGTSQEGKMVSPGILHYNCQPGAGNDVWLFEQNHTGGSHFGPMITTTLRYKWAWLNRGDGSATVQTSIKPDVRWWDERLYNAQH